MKNLKPFIIGIIGIVIGFGIAIYLGQADPPDSVHLIGLFIGFISAFYVIIVGVLRFGLYMLKMLGYIPKD